MRTKFSFFLISVLATILFICCSSNGASDETISLKTIAGVTAPVTGATPVTTIDASQYAGTISWNPAVSGSFATATVYAATITLTPKDGFTLSGVPANSFTVIGGTATNAAGSGVVTVVFTSTTIPAPVYTVNLTAIPGVTAPVTGGTPVTTLDASQYTGTVSWNPAVSDTFAVGNAYTATITLKAKQGFTLSGMAANCFTVTGATATNAAGSGVVSTAFPSTTVVSVYQTAIPGVITPVTGAAPVSTLDAGQYTGTISWNPTGSGNFAAATAYTATITLTPKDGFILAGVAANSFTVAGATATNAAGTGVVSAIFPETSICKLISVPAGRFLRDYNNAANISTVSAFRMSECEITRVQFKKIMGGNDPSGDTESGGEKAPVQNVTWYMAIAYCNKLSIAEGLNPVYAVSGVNFNELSYANIPVIYNDTWNKVTANWNNNGYRLPTDMEWKWAAMGAPTTGQNGFTNTDAHTKPYAGSTEGSGISNIKNYAWYDGNNSSKKTHEVGLKLPNELGLYDMSGNVNEWCWDWHDTSPTGLLIDYRGGVYKNSFSSRRINGGCYADFAEYCSVSYYNYDLPQRVWWGIGFRVVRQ